MEDNAVQLEFRISEIVYLRNDPDMLGRFVTGVLLTVAGTQYQLTNGPEITYHYGFEITRDKQSPTIYN
jgi:hypothetical protein